MKTKKLSLSLLSLLALFSCSRNEEFGNDSNQKIAKNNPSDYFKSCGFIDGNWSPNAVLSSTIINPTQTFLINNQNQKIANVFDINPVSLSFVVDPVTPSSTNNAFSYKIGSKIYYGEELYKRALAKDQIVPAYILAHEVVHQLQFRFLGAFFDGGESPSTLSRNKELHADCLGGYYLRRPNGYNAKTFDNILPAYRFANASGDNDTSSPTHHGTGAQRRFSLRLGWLLGEVALTRRELTVKFFDNLENILFASKQSVINSKSIENKELNEKVNNIIASHYDELQRILSGEMTEEEFLKLK